MYCAINTEYEYELFTSSYSRTSTLVREYVIYYYYSTPLWYVVIFCCIYCMDTFIVRLRDRAGA